MMQPWRMIAEPHEDIRLERFDPAVFAADLGMVLQHEGPTDYHDPETFFKKTYLTQGLSNLLLDALYRLSGSPRGEAVMQIQTPFGGGKTHVLIALYHLLAHADEVDHMDSIRDLLEQADLERIPACRVAALVGTALDPVQGRQTEGQRIRTLWGEMAHQLGGVALFERVRANDEERVAPGTDRLMELLDGLGPVLILVDEALEYATKAGGVQVGEGTLLGQTLAFLQELSGVAANRPQTVLVGALPSSYLERFDASAQKAFQQLSKVFGRLEQIRTPVEGTEIYEILRRRLFEDVGNEAQRKQVAGAYWDFYLTHSEDFPRKVNESSYRDRMVGAYPFHPELVDILYERWGSLPNFQRTRGVLRLLALVVGDLHKRGVPDPLIHPAHVNLNNSRIRREFINLVGDEYETVIGSDIAGHAAKAPRIDQELGGAYAQEKIAQGLGTSIFLYSHTGGMDQGAVLPQLRLSVLHPEMTPALVADALDRLNERLWYLYADPKWYFSKIPNLNKIQVEREDAIKEEEIEERIRGTLSDLAGRQEFKRVYLWPQEDRDIADDRDLGLVILDPGHLADSRPAEAFVQDLLKRRGESFRVYRNTLVFLVASRSEVERMRGAARTLLALEGIAVDYGASDRLTDRQQEKLEKDLANARSALPQMVYQAYRHVLIPGEGDELLRFDLGLQLLKGGRSLSREVWEHLLARDRILDRLDPHLLRAERWNLWLEREHPLQVSQLREYFARYTHLPMLANEEVLRQTIARGVELRLFGYGGRGGEGEGFSPLYYGQVVSSAQIEVADTSWLIPPDMAQALSLGSITGGVIDEESVPMSGVTVRLSPTAQAVTTGADGSFAFEQLPPDTYTLAASNPGYSFSPTSRSVTLSGGQDVSGLEFVGKVAVGRRDMHEVTGQIRTEDDQPLAGVRLTIDPPLAAESVSDAKGVYTFSDLPSGSYTIRPQKSDYDFEPVEVALAVHQDQSGLDFVAKRKEKGGRAIEIHTKLPWEKWYDFYGDSIDPLMSIGAEIEISLRLAALSEDEFPSEVIERLRDSLGRYDQEGEVEIK